MKTSDFKPGVKRFMAVGPIRTGKSMQFLTIPGRKFAIVTDPNAMDTLSQFANQEEVHAEVFLPDNLNYNMQTLARAKRDTDVRISEPLAYKRFVEFFHSFLNDTTEPHHHSNFDLVLVDGATSLQEIAMDRTLYLNDRPGKFPERDDWASFANTLRSVFRELAALNRTIYLTAHMELKDTKLEGITQVIKLMGDLKGTIPPNFTDIWYFFNDLDDRDEPVYKVQTRSDHNKRTLGCSIAGIKTFEDVTCDLSKPLVGQGVGKLLIREGVVSNVE